MAAAAAESGEGGRGGVFCVCTRVKEWRRVCPFGYWATSDEWAAVFSPLALSIQHGESGVFVCNFLLVFEIKKLDSSKSNKLETPFQEFLSFSLSRSSSF
jgi:hypothetical protein